MRRNSPILLVEDDQVDRLTIQRALKQLEIHNPLYFSSNGEEALAFLRSPTQSKPGLIILDLNMPRMGGVEFLRHKLNDTQIQHIPVVVLTTSDEEQDITAAFDLGAKGYMVKPVDYTRFVEIIQVINQYWDFSETPVRSHKKP